MVLTHVLLPLYLLYTLWAGRERSSFDRLVKVLYVGAFILYMVLIGNWSWLSYYLRAALLIAYAGVVFIVYRRQGTSPSARGPQWSWSTAGSLLVLLLFVGMVFFVLSGHFYAGEAVRLEFPLRDGVYYVGQGGNNVLLNYHNAYPPQRYAIDVLQLNAAGVRAIGLTPADLTRYVIYGATVYSPCDGIVKTAVDGLPDHIPPATDVENPAGNHVVIECHGVLVTLAHFHNGSVLVRAGDSVMAGDPLAEVGNSGNTSEPHLHIHAVSAGTDDASSGEGVPILYDGKFPVRNSLFIR
jgi:hypothetical protein